ncbi:hypothetical protein BFJ63_vAg1411 [Fusarium oxysporum f. sp. narcissi]|uniref:Uncharacterized protein n=1 Tax=Fusarium oxysporum f. sp. narcissi TaxID=451672 RepID=A0A4Q2W878_FUSOX|nr:hypothetical protein BFJ70_g1169 [Fusarium oxysporum]RYC95595.1 hypothetical protein BFJ63_vAg1411 [Fusarium oxysporum f. sp. narcissi]
MPLTAGTCAGFAPAAISGLIVSNSCRIEAAFGSVTCFPLT